MQWARLRAKIGFWWSCSGPKWTWWSRHLFWLPTYAKLDPLLLKQPHRLAGGSGRVPRIVTHKTRTTTRLHAESCMEGMTGGASLLARCTRRVGPAGRRALHSLVRAARRLAHQGLNARSTATSLPHADLQKGRAAAIGSERSSASHMRCSSGDDPLQDLAEGCAPGQSPPRRAGPAWAHRDRCF